MDTVTFLTTLYVMVDDFCMENLAPECHCGPKASLSRSEVITLAIFGQWERFASERDFYRFASVVSLTLLYIWRSWLECARPGRSRRKESGLGYVLRYRPGWR